MRYSRYDSSRRRKIAANTPIWNPRNDVETGGVQSTRVSGTLGWVLRRLGWLTLLIEICTWDGVFPTFVFNVFDPIVFTDSKKHAF